MDPDEWLRRAADKHNQATATPTAEIERSEEQRRREILESSLGDATGLSRAIEIVAGGLVLFLPAVVVVLLFGSAALDSGYVLAGVAVVSLAAMGAFMVARERASIALDRRRIAKLGFGFDAKAYLAQLSHPRHDGPVVVFIHFAAPLDAGARALVASASRGSLPELAAADWDDDRVALRLTTAPQMGVDSAVTSMGGSRWYTNAAAHKAVMRIFRRLVPPLSSAHAVKRVEVELGGAVISPARD